MMKIGLDSMEVRAVFRRSLTGKLEGKPLMDRIAYALGEVVEKNNKKLWETLQESLKEGNDHR